jgi:signal transduction histidine kinase
MSLRQAGSSLGFERLIFWLRWPYWGLVLLLALVSSNFPLDPATLGALIAVAAGLNIVLFVLCRLEVAPRVILPVFSSIDVLLTVALLFSSGRWPTPLYALLAFPVATIALRWGGLAGLGAGLLSGLAGLAVWAMQRAHEVAALSTIDQIIALAALPLLGGVIGLLSSRAASQELQALSVEVHELRHARERSDGVYAMASTLGATLNYQRVLETLFDVSAIEFRALGLDTHRMVGMALLFEERSHRPALQVVAGHRLHADDWGIRCPANAGVLASTLKQVEALVFSSIADDAELCQFASLKSARSTIIVPLRAGFDSYGVIVFASEEENAFDLDRCHFLVAFSGQATIALQNARLFQNLRDEQDRIINQQEEIRRQIARELHDGPTQTVASLAMRLNYARALVEKAPEKAAKELAELEDMARRTAKEIRTMLFTLRPVVLETQGLAAALRQYGERLQESDGLVVNVNDSQFDGLLSDDMAGVVFSIMEEAINNARKHARAQQVNVRLLCEGGTFLAEVQDNGMGFDLNMVEQTYDQRGSLGLINMKERAALIEGNLSITSTPGQGTTITLAAPLMRSDVSLMPGKPARS